MVHAEHDGRGGLVLGRSGDQDLLGASVDVGLGLLSGGVEAGALEHELNTVVLDPRDVVGILLGVDLVFLPSTTMESSVEVTSTGVPSS